MKPNKISRKEVYVIIPEARWHHLEPCPLCGEVLADFEDLKKHRVHNH